MSNSFKESSDQKGGSISLPVVLVLLLVTVIYRVGASHFGFLGNTAPLMAVCFGGALLLGARFWWVPILLLIVSDLILGFVHGGGGIGKYTFMSAAFYALVAWAGSRSGRWSGKVWPMMWCGTLIAGIGFYLFANTFAWAVYPGYAKTLAGWWQSQTTGVPGYPPSWVFLRNSIIADSVWCAIAGLIFFRKTLPATHPEKSAV